MKIPRFQEGSTLDNRMPRRLISDQVTLVGAVFRQGLTARALAWKIDR
jgi:hypothetical protein